ncbi:Nucleotide-binding protein implicated in inhibition of septum formation [Paramagnetospirillum magneticum AMB-1]|uniref:Nucleoside triphosphate pyrophosphatase n=1 Tax=Paramagnetospirillum magneticum (strain ATCC 700264 / AMB-1) TaxID=342108 RepID=NTPP_PARM1|nr:RecName: Full=Nucleoside triphosphate pyrophosphatase; AltName: Full=Nucleotide pyrophosphatase; Short=Nucleotide PPase [Paramagnetospirillum magneticum AMB-1]BAE53352.1 Nucleotide-binding protein implicated in inhibition of septum formation [Paramagnetospirillum magneticum AMB-1]
MLASGSTARARMLEQAGIAFTVDVAAVDEEAVKHSMAAETRNPARVAEILAELKAVRVSARHPGALVIGADQMLDCDNVWFDKPADRQGARAQLLALRHKTHRLTSAVVAVRDGRRVWHHTEAAKLTMRNFSENFLDGYLDQAGEAVQTSVGAYQLEGLGSQLFLSVEGDFFTILGLPLLALMDFLRENGELVP